MGHKSICIQPAHVILFESFDLEDEIDAARFARAAAPSAVPAANSAFAAAATAASQALSAATATCLCLHALKPNSDADLNYTPAVVVRNRGDKKSSTQKPNKKHKLRITY